MEEAEAAYRARQAESARYKAEIAQVKTQIRNAALTSPLVGVVAQKNFNKG